MKEDLMQKAFEKLETTTQHLWPLAIRQQYIIGLTHLGFIVLIVIGGLLWWRAAKKEIETGTDLGDALFDKPFLGITAVILTVCGFLAVVMVIIENPIARVLNPEWSAIQDILGRK